MNEDFLCKLNNVYEEYLEKDPIKYDSFLRIVKDRYEGYKGYECIKQFDLSYNDSSEDND